MITLDANQIVRLEKAEEQVAPRKVEVEVENPTVQAARKDHNDGNKNDF